jgi:hypothetical protein
LIQLKHGWNSKTLTTDAMYSYVQKIKFFFSQISDTESEPFKSIKQGAFGNA